MAFQLASVTTVSFEPSEYVMIIVAMTPAGPPPFVALMAKVLKVGWRLGMV